MIEPVAYLRPVPVQWPVVGPNSSQTQSVPPMLVGVLQELQPSALLVASEVVVFR